MEGFFAIGLAEWQEACALGLNPASAFLVMACGTGGDNRTTSWSSTAVEKYAGISWVRAKPAIEQLEGAGLVERTDKSTTNKPRYKLRISDDRIWLPKSIVMPLQGELPPLARIRQTQDIMTLRLFIELYYAQNLAADGGLSRSVYYTTYTRKVYAERGQFTMLGFDVAHSWVSYATEVTKAHVVPISKAEEKAGKNSGELFFKRISTLHDLGLLERAVCLFESDSDEAEILFPVDGPTPAEKSVGAAADAAAERLLEDWQYGSNPHRYLVPVYRHQAKAQMYGVYRLRHRPHTKMTGAWWLRSQARIDNALKSFQAMEG